MVKATSKAAALKLQAEEAQRNLVNAQSQLDQLTSETQHQHRTSDEKDPELQEEVERLQNALKDLRGEATWEAKRQSKGYRHSPTQASSSDRQRQNPSQHALDKPKYKPSAEQNREATESAEIMRLLKELLQEKSHKGDKKDESDRL
ncbi:hypothetical protein G5714_000225 [Onychostoma macrolepis]|uniref:Uncharacterized protein n=1 Tax=Onychostoma macrolepis TaxID=369639 RepID=A0A7J6DHC6_9TELE|nr:hypothetical protein G5714_000225 [Onychostoma macrolepis]